VFFVLGESIIKQPVARRGEHLRDKVLIDISQISLQLVT
jgi:hypothetical protein